MIHSGRLTSRDLFPGVLWTEQQWHAKWHELRADLEASGLTGAELYFATQRAMENYQAKQPSLRDRQAIMRRIYPVEAVHLLGLSEQEMDYLREKLAGVNDPIGRKILDRLGK